MNKEKKIQQFFRSNGVLFYTIIVFSFGAVLLGGIVYVFFIRKQINLDMQITLIVAVVIEIIALSLCFALIRVRTVLRNLEKKNQLILSSNIQTSELNDKMRTQRHDFLNHLQVIHGLLELNQYDEAKSYMEKTYDEVQTISNVLKTSVPAINALLQVKGNNCHEKNITFKILTTSKLNHLSIDVWDLCAILGNLIDNAINAAEQSENKKIVVFIKEELHNYVIKVKDSGKGIPPTIIDKIFTMGFSTKHDDGHGIGLPTSKQTIENAKGSLIFETSTKGTIFTIRLPKMTV